MNSNRFAVILLMALSALFAAGCGPQTEKGVVVKGKVLKGGAPIPGIRPDVGVGMIQISLMPQAPTNPNAEPSVALLKADGSFEILGLGKGIPPGKYKVVLMQRDLSPGGAGAIPDSFSEANSTLEVDIPADKLGSSHDLGVIDVEKPPTS